MKLLLATALTVLSTQAQAVSVEDMVLVPDMAHPFYISIFEVSDQKLNQVLGIKRYNGDDWPTRVETSQEAAEFCRRQGLRLPTLAEWMQAASNMGQHQNFTVVGDSVNGSSKAFNYNGGDSVKTYDIDRLGIDGIGTVGMSGNRSEWVIDESGNYQQCGGDYLIKDVNQYKLAGICGNESSPMWSKGKRATARCVIDYSADVQVTYTSRVKGKLKEYLEKLANGGTPVVAPGSSDITIGENSASQRPVNDPKRLNAPAPHYNGQNGPKLDEEF
jgi:hypothetical protein